MKPLVILLVTFALALGISKVATGYWNMEQCGNIAMCAMLLFTAVGHFVYVMGMEMMLPQAIPFKKTIVYLSGVFELIMGIAILFPYYRVMASLMLIVFFIAIIPANISAAMRRVNYQKGTLDGDGPGYLWFRIPLQIFFIAWVWYFGIFLLLRQNPVYLHQ